MTLPVFPSEGGGSKIHAIVEDDGAGSLRAVPVRSRKSQVVDGERLGSMATYPESGTLENGVRTTTGSTAIALSSTSIPCQGLVVKALSANATTIWVGKSDVTADTTATTGGYPLDPGESVGVPCRDVNEVYIRGAASGLSAAWLASAD